MFKAGIFDLDDTIYNYQDLSVMAIENLRHFTCDKLGISEESFHDAFHKARKETKEIPEQVAAQHNRLLYCQKMLENLSVPPVRLSLDMYDVYWNTILDNMELHEGVIEVFEWLKKRNIGIAICTDLTAHIQHRKVRKLGIENYIDVFVSSEEAGREKPDKRIFHLCLKKLGLNASECFFLGDNYEKDIIGALNVGITPLWFRDPLRCALDYPDQITAKSINNFKGIIDWLEKHEKEKL